MITALDLKERSQIELCIIDLFKTNDSFSIDLIDNLNKLPYKNRVVIDLSYIEGFTHELISEHLSIPWGTVKSRLKIGLRELRKIYSVKISD